VLGHVRVHSKRMLPTRVFSLKHHAGRGLNTRVQRSGGRVRCRPGGFNGPRRRVRQGSGGWRRDLASSACGGGVPEGRWFSFFFSRGLLQDQLQSRIPRENIARLGENLVYPRKHARSNCSPRSLEHPERSFAKDCNRTIPLLRGGRMLGAQKPLVSGAVGLSRTPSIGSSATSGVPPSLFSAFEINDPALKPIRLLRRETPRPPRNNSPPSASKSADLDVAFPISLELASTPNRSSKREIEVGRRGDRSIQGSPSGHRTTRLVCEIHRRRWTLPRVPKRPRRALREQTPSVGKQNRIAD